MSPADVAPRLVRTRRTADDGSAPARRVLLVHPGAVDVAEYAVIAAALPDDHEVVAVDLERVPEYFRAALTGGRSATSIDRIAGLAVAAARELAPVSSWTLAGWSFGGAVAHAMLDRLGPDERPDHLVVIDALAPVPEYTAADEGPGGDLDPRAVLAWFAVYLAAKRGAAVDVDAAELRALPLDAGVERVLEAGIAGGALRPGTPAVGLRKVFDAYRDGLVRNNRLVLAHRAVPTTVGLTLLRPEHGLFHRPGVLGWDTVTTAPVRQTTCPGDHYTCLRMPETAALFASAAVPARSTTLR